MSKCTLHDDRKSCTKLCSRVTVGAPSKELRLVFTAFPGPHGEAQFVEAEDSTGRSVNAGQWHQRSDGLVELRIPNGLA